LLFDRNSRDCEDFIFNNNLTDKGFKCYSISSLVVDHRETKSFWQAMRWLFQSGKGASRLLKQFGKIRLPDLTFFGLLITLVLGSILSIVFHSYIFIWFTPLFIVFTSILHIYTKFKFHTHSILPYIAAILVNSVLLLCYYFGRVIGVFSTNNTT